MENVLYSSVIVPAAESEDGDTPTILYVCKEANAVIVWNSSFADGTQFLKSFSGSNPAIEFAVDEARRRRAELKKAA
jgi:hypothetical protein